MPDAWQTFAAVGLGGLVSLGTTVTVEWFKDRRAIEREARLQRVVLETRWDSDLRVVAAEFVATARRLVHVARRLDRSVDRKKALRRLDEQHETLRSLVAQIGLLGSLESQTAARLVVREAYEVRGVAEQRQADPKAAAAAYGAILTAIAQFQRAVRRQLRMPNADELFDEQDADAVLRQLAETPTATPLQDQAEPQKDHARETPSPVDHSGTTS